MARALIIGMGAALAFAGLAWAQTSSIPAGNDYARPETWLCLPGRTDACAADQTATIVAANGTLTREAFTPAADPGVDCFYVYPTVSNDPTGNSDMTANAEELFVVSAQFARFGAVCRTFAPLYRQITLTALRGFMTGKPIPADRELGYGDVKAAWDWYLKHENKGRGVILIGHSQGSGVLQRLLKEEIDGKPAGKLLVSAMLIGTNVPVKDGRFGGIPVCASADQTGCLISYVSFRDTVPPPATSRFGVVAEPGATAACVNPAMLGGSGALSSYLWALPRGGSDGATARPWATGQTVGTPWVATPGLLSAQCVQKDGFSYLSVHVNADPADPRTDDITGDVVAMGKVDANWGLHLIDMNLAMGDLVRVAKAQAAAWTAKGS
ncbi:MAG: DUF3089 domain-containing protein [Caulobacter sp.]|nr:DUF3089 domain-containing protein [Caulobacter sp.]